MSMMLRSLSRPKLLAATLVAAALLGFFAWLIVGQQHPLDRVLFGNVPVAEVAPMTRVLDAAGIAYRLGPDGTAIMVSEADLGRARMLVAGEGLPQTGPAGYELMDAGQSLGSTQFRDEITYLRAVEGELARSIGSLRGVRAAKIHIVMAKREPFSREWTPPTASVLLTVASPDLVGREEVAAIRHLVAAAVPRLRIEDISIIDNYGNLLARAERGGDAELDRNDQRRVALEERIARAIEEQLTPIVGPGRVRAKVSAELDFSSRRTVEESFDSLGQVPRSEQDESERERTNETEPNVSVERDLPENVDRAPPAGSETDRQRSKKTINYEIGKTVREHVVGGGELRRLSVSLAVDGICELDGDGRTVCQARPAEELERLERLARATAGVSDERGDSFEIASVPFSALEPVLTREAADEAAALAPARDPLPLLIGAGVTLAALLGGGWFFFRRRRQRAAAAAAAERATAEAAALEEQARMAAVTAEQAALPAADGATRLVSRSAVDQLPAPDPGEPVVDLGRNIQGGVRRSTIARVQQMIDQDVDDAVAFLRAWLSEKREVR